MSRKLRSIGSPQVSAQKRGANLGHLGTSKIVSSRFLAAEATRNDNEKGKLFGTLRVAQGQAQGLEVVPFPACSAPNFAGACGVARKCVGPSSGVLRERRTPLPPG